MTLALSRLLPLNGNKRLALFVLPVLMLSCGAFKHTVVEEPAVNEEVVIEPNEEEVQQPEKKLIPPILKEYNSVIFQGETYRVPAHKNEFEIAVLLPFHLSGTRSTVDERRAAIMLEYYQGMLIAAKHAEDLGSRFRIRFYDTNNDTSELSRILQRPGMKKVDLIIGPTDDRQVLIAAQFAKKYKIPLFSPLSTVDHVWSNNPYLYNLRPSDAQMAVSLVDHIRSQHHGKKVIILRDGKRLDKTFGSALIDALSSAGINYEKYAISKPVDWAARLGEQNLVINLSTDKLEVTRIINQLLKYEEKVTLMGPDKWLELSSVDFTYWNRLKVHFFSENLAQVPNARSIRVVEDYREDYRNDPSFYTYWGYDHLIFACEILDAFGEHFSDFLMDKRVYYANSVFCFTKQDNCYQNHFIQVFKYEDLEVKALDPK